MKPSYLYKYFTPVEHNFQALEQCKLYFPKPGTFDDPYDCNIQLSPDVTARELAILLAFDNEVKTTHAMPNPDKTTIEKWVAQHQEVAQRNLPASRSFVARLLGDQRERISQWGIACLTERGTDIMLFSLYADHHRGFCLQFDADCPPFSNARQVEYSDEIPRLDIEDEMLNFPNSAVKVLTIKSRSWECEREWRLPIENGNTYVPYDPDCLSAVHLGLRMDDRDEERITKALEAAYPHTRLFRMIYSPAEFRLVKDGRNLRRTR